MKARFAELGAATKVRQAVHKDPELTSLEKTRDQASGEQQVKALAAYQSRIGELENTRHQLAEIARLQSNIAWTNAERATLYQQLHAKDAELGRITAQHFQERESQRANVQVLQDAADARENVMDIDIVPDHVCDDSRCLDQANLCAGQIENLEASLMDRDLKIDRLRFEAEEQVMKIEGLLAQLAGQKTAIARE